MEFMRRVLQKGATSTPKGGRTHTHSSTSGSSRGPPPLLRSELIILEELGMKEDSPLHLLRESIFSRFDDLCDESGRVGVDLFIKDCLARGIAPDWADAAFRAYESPPSSGCLTAFTYLCAITSLLTAETALHNRKAWVKLRRKTIFSKYDVFNMGALELPQFEVLMDEMASSDLALKCWGLETSEESLAEREINFSPGSVNSSADISASLALTKVQLAEATSDLQQSRLDFLQLEKKYCGLKLELAEERARKER